MTAATKDLTARALALKPEERVELAEALLASVGDFTSPEIEAAWREEIRQRVEEIETGRAKLVPAMEVHRKASAAVHEAHRLSRRR